VAYFDGNREFDALCKILPVRKRITVKAALSRRARAASDVREKASLKFHVTTKWKQFDTRPATALYIKFKKAALGFH